MEIKIKARTFIFILIVSAPEVFTSSLPCRKKDQFAVLYFSTSLIVLIQVYNPVGGGGGGGVT